MGTHFDQWTIARGQHRPLESQRGGKKSYLDQGTRSGGFPARAFSAAFSSLLTFSRCLSSSDLVLWCVRVCVCMCVQHDRGR